MRLKIPRNCKPPKYLKNLRKFGPKNIFRTLNLPKFHPGFGPKGSQIFVICIYAQLLHTKMQPLAVCCSRLYPKETNFCSATDLAILGGFEGQLVRRLWFHRAEIFTKVNPCCSSPTFIEKILQNTFFHGNRMDPKFIYLVQVKNCIHQVILKCQSQGPISSPLSGKNVITFCTIQVFFGINGRKAKANLTTTFSESLYKKLSSCRSKLSVVVCIL